MPIADLFTSSASTAMGNSQGFSNNTLGNNSPQYSDSQPLSLPPSGKSSLGSRDFENSNHAFPPDLATKFHRAFKNFLDADDLSQGPFDSNVSSLNDDTASLNSNQSIKARKTIESLADAQLKELCADVYDELQRRNDNAKYSRMGKESNGYFQSPPPSALPYRHEYNERRNKAREGLSKMSPLNYKVLVENIVRELQHRYPTTMLLAMPYTSTGSLASNSRFSPNNSNPLTSNSQSNSSSKKSSPPFTGESRQVENAFSNMHLNSGSDGRPGIHLNGMNEPRHVYPATAAPPVPVSPKKANNCQGGAANGHGTFTGNNFSNDNPYNGRSNYSNQLPNSYSSNNPYSTQLPNNRFDNRSDNRLNTKTDNRSDSRNDNNIFSSPAQSFSSQNATRNSDERLNYEHLNQKLIQQENSIVEYKETIEKLTRDNKQLFTMVEHLARQLEDVAKDEFGQIEEEEKMLSARKQRLRVINESLQMAKKSGMC